MLVNTGKANGVGYAALFKTIVSYIREQEGLKDEYASSHCIGVVYVFGRNVHSIFASAFFGVHGFNKLTDLKTNKRVYIDSSISDYVRLPEMTVSN